MLLCQRVTYDTTYCSLQFDLNIAGSFRRSLFQISVHPDVTPNTAKSTNKKKNLNSLAFIVLSSFRALKFYFLFDAE